jgi:hypothetical protein
VTRDFASRHRFSLRRNEVEELSLVTWKEYKMDTRRKGPPRPSSPVTFWPGLTQIIPSQPVQRPPPPVHRPPPADGASIRTGSSHGSSTIKASRAHFGLFGFVTRSKDKSNTDGSSTVSRPAPKWGIIDNGNYLYVLLELFRSLRPLDYSKRANPRAITFRYSPRP